MSLKVAVQMDPLERINIEGDTTFLMMLSAQARGAYSRLNHCELATTSWMSARSARVRIAALSSLVVVSWPAAKRNVATLTTSNHIIPLSATQRVIA